MASVRTDKVQLELDVKADQAKTELDNVLRKEKLITEELKGMKKGTDEYIKANKELKQVQTQAEALRKELGLTGLSLQQLDKYSRDLTRELRGLAPGTETFINKAKELTQVKARADEVRRSMSAIGDEIDNTGNGFLDLVKKSAVFTGVHLGIEAIVSSVRQIASASVNSAAKTSDSLADIQKATGLTKDEVTALNEEFKEIDTRTTQQALQDIAVVGGQIGVAADQIDEFTIATDKAVVALGDEFTGGAEEVAKAMGGLQKLFKETADLDAGDAINKIGSAINALGADGTATGPVVADFTSRIGQLGDLAPEISQTLGLGAAFQELGLSAEISAGGLSNILLTASKDTAAFAKQIGVTEAEFQNLINTNPNEALLRIAESLKGASNTEIVQTLTGLGIKSQEATKVMSLLANQTELVRQKQALASEEMEKATSVTDEFNIKNNTLAAQIEKSDKELAELTDELGNSLAPAYIKVIGGIGVFVEILRATPAFLRENKDVIGTLAFAILTLNAANIKTAATTLYHTAVEKGRAIATNASAIAQRVLNAAMSANPIGLLITAVGLLVGGFVILYNRSEAVRAGMAGLFAAFKELISIAGDIASFLINPIKNAGKLAEIKNAGERLGNAFSEGYNQKIAEGAKKTEQEQKVSLEKQTQDEVAHAENKAKALTAVQKRQIEQYRRLVDESRGSGTALDTSEVAKLQKALAAEGKKVAEERKKQLDLETKDQLQAAKSIQDYKLGLIVDEFDRKIEQLKVAAEREKEAVKGLATQVAEQRLLIDKKLDLDIKAVEKTRAAERLKLAQETAERETQIRRTALLKEAELDVLVNSRKDVTGKLADEGALLTAKLKQLDVQKRIELEKAEETAREKLAQDIKNLQLTGDAKTAFEMESLVALNNEKLVIEEQFQQQRSELAKNYVEQANQKELAQLTQGIQFTQQATAEFFEFRRIANDREMQKNEQDKAKRLKNLDAEFRAGRVSKEQYEAQKSAIEANYDEKTRALKRKQAQDEKAAKIAQSIMAGTLAVLAASANPLGFLSPTAIATAIFAAAGLAKIIATPVPTFAKGGMVGLVGKKIQNFTSATYQTVKHYATGGKINPVAGVPSVGQYHGQGGIKMLDGKTGEYLGEWERDEPYMILSRNTYKNNRVVIDSLLDSSLHRGGAPIQVGKRNIYAAEGAVLGNRPTLPGGGQTESESFDALLEQMVGMREDLQAMPRVLKAYVVATEARDAIAELENIEEESGL